MNLILKKINVTLVPLALLLVSSSIASAWYDPGIQRWINRDPIADRAVPLAPHVRSGPASDGSDQAGRNGYVFVSNRPVSFVDALGLWDGNPFVSPADDPSFQLGVCISIAKRRLNEYRDLVRSGNAHTDTDKWFHCVVSCEMTRACGTVAAGLIADFHERLHPGDPIDTALDQVANQTGRRLGSDCRNKKSCEKGCEDSGYSK